LLWCDGLHVDAGFTIFPFPIISLPGYMNSVVSIPILSITLGSMAYSRATLGTAAGSWLLLSTSLGDYHGTGACCVGAVTLRSLLPSILGSRISHSLQSLSTMSLCSCGGTPVVRVFASPPMAATIWSSGVTDGLVRCLCLNHTTPDTSVVCMSFIQTFWH
jgi:hypothetical protein